MSSIGEAFREDLTVFMYLSLANVTLLKQLIKEVFEDEFLTAVKHSNVVTIK